MCGIVVIFEYSRQRLVSESELIKITDAMAARGPDGSGRWLAKNGYLGLGHRRLSIIDLSNSGAQPMADLFNGNQIVFNGEIYNYKQLRYRLLSTGIQFSTTSDTEVLLALYRKYGSKMVHYIDGMYAFAIWDQEKEGLFIARDPFGIKPLYIADDGCSLRIASQVRALTLSEKVDKSPSPAGQVGFYLFGHVPEPHTLFNGVKSFPPGTTIWVDKSGNKKVDKFYDLKSNLVNLNQDAVIIDNWNAKKRLSAALKEAVKSHLMADVPVGIFLSGGLDSSTILALASEIKDENAADFLGTLKTITVGFRDLEGTPDDEVLLAENLALNYGSEHKTSWISEDDFLEHYEKIIKSMDQPSIDGINTYFASLAAKRAGLKVMLSGVGADEIFGGYSTFREIPKIVSLLKLLPFGSAIGKSLRKTLISRAGKYVSPKMASIFEYGGSYSSAYLLRRCLFMPWELNKYLDDDFLATGLRELSIIESITAEHSQIHEPYLKISALETALYMRNQLLRDSDWAGMANSVEIRVPFLDLNLYETYISLFKSGFMMSKRAMSSSPVNSLPAYITNRGKKIGFSTPINKWTKNLASPYSFGENGIRPWALHLIRKYE